MPVRGGGFIQGLNAQAVFSADGLCLAAMVTRDTTDYASFEPMMARPRPPRTCCARTPAGRCTGCAPDRRPCSPTPGTAPKPTWPAPDRTG